MNREVWWKLALALAVSAVIITTGILLLGCGDADKTATSVAASAPAASQDGTNASQTRSTAATVIDGITGKAAVDAGRQAKAKIERISAERNKDLEEATK